MLSIHFDFSAAGASYASNAQQAAAVQTVMQSLKLTDNTYAPLALDRAVSFALTDALGEHAEVLSGVRITAVADTGTLNGVNYVTGTESVETLTGTAAAETLVDNNGKANGGGFEKTWFVTLDNVSMDTSNNVVVNGATMGATAAGLSGNVTLDNLLQQMVADSQFKLL